MSNNTGLTVDQKFAKALVELQERRPFYSAVFQTIPHIETDTVPTMGVNCKELVYNPEFVENLSMPQFMFVVLHEIAHIALMHPTRGIGRDHTLFNIACDLYVNSMLAEEFQITPGKSWGTTIEMPKQCLYCPSLNLDVDYVEDIYDKLMQQAEKNGYNKIGQDGQSYDFSYTGSGNNGSRWNNDNSGNDNGEFKIRVTKKYVGDLMDNGDDPLMQESENRRILSEAVTRSDMMKKGCGDGEGRLRLSVDSLLKSKIDWKKLLRKYCITHTMKDSSFKIPDKRMYYQRAIYPGQQAEESNILKNVKLCVDTSGSMSNTDIAYVLGQVYDLMKQFKTYADLIGWDCSVESVQPLQSDTTLENRMRTGRLLGGGGTSPSCIFKYFDSKQCKVKPYVTLVFTDAYFSTDDFLPSWKRKYKDTIWIMTRDYNSQFKPPFGKIAFAKFSSEKND